MINSELSSCFNSAQIQTWKRSGYLLINDFFNDKMKANLVSYTDELYNWPETPGMWMKYFEKNQAGLKQLCRVENFIPYHENLCKLLNHPDLLHRLSLLLGEKAVLFKEKINYKLPGGGGFTPHQDAPAFIRFNQNFHITMMIAIDEATLENGCLHIAENYHRRGLLPQANDGSIHPNIHQLFSWQPLYCKQGDIVLFDSYIPHFSNVNHSDQPRRAFYITYNGLSQGTRRQDYYQDKRAHFPPECERQPGIDYSAGSKIYNLANPIDQ